MWQRAERRPGYKRRGRLFQCTAGESHGGIKVATQRRHKEQQTQETQTNQQKINDKQGLGTQGLIE